MGVAFANWSSLNPDVLLEDVKVINPNGTGLGYADFGWSSEENTIAANSGFVVSAVPTDPYTGTGLVDFRNCVSEDERDPSTMNNIFYLHSSDPAKWINAIISQ